MKLATIAATLAVLHHPVTSAAVIKPLIFGGTEVPIGTKTYMTGLRLTSMGTDATRCGGSLIFPTHVLSAAHCYSGDDMADMYVAIGTHYKSGSADGEKIQVARVTVHPLYEELGDATLIYDVMVLELERPSKFTPVKLAPSDWINLAGASAMPWAGGEQTSLARYRPCCCPWISRSGATLPARSSSDSPTRRPCVGVASRKRARVRATLVGR